MKFSLLDQIEKLINEHGSAVILKERLALADDRFSDLQAENANLANLVENLQSQNSVLSEQNEELQENLQKLESDMQFKNQFVNHGGLLWKHFDGKFETTPYCKKCTLPMYDADNEWICTHCGHATQHISPPTV